MKLIFVSLLLIAAPFGVYGQTIKAASSPPAHYDVIVAGAGTGGVSASIQAARMGAHVALLEETDWIGGQIAAGVGTMDEGVGVDSTPPSGLYAVFLARAHAYYDSHGKSMSTCYWRATLSHCITPSDARRIFMDMIDDVNSNSKGHIDLHLQDRIVKVLTDGETVTGVITSRKEHWSSSVLIDATEYGDVIPLTPARYRMGHAINPDNEPECIQAITWVAEIKKYADGVPRGFLTGSEPPDYQRWKNKFEASMRADGNPGSRILPVGFDEYVAYRGLPDPSNPQPYKGTDIGKITRSSMNWFNDLDVTTDIFDRKKRPAIICEAKLETLANIYYFQHVMGQTQWSVANDEGFDTPYNAEHACPIIPADYKLMERNLPQIPYVRESIRIIGEYTLTGGDIRRESDWAMSVRGFTDAIAVGDYADDLHSCNEAPEVFENDLEHITDLPPNFRFGAFQVPLRSLIPEKVDGFLAAEKNISQSRLANGATRLQPITMLTGQAAGALAALAVSEHKQPRSVDAQQVQFALLAAGDILARQHIYGLAVGSPEWQAVEFSLVNDWLNDETSSTFDPQTKLTRADAAHILARVFLSENEDNLSVTNTTGGFDKAPISLKQIYADVPLYSKDFNVTTSLHNEDAIRPCERMPDAFCLEDAMTIGDFIHSVLVLMKRREWAVSARSSDLLKAVKAEDRQPLTALDASMILYNASLQRSHSQGEPRSMRVAAAY